MKLPEVFKKLLASRKAIVLALTIAVDAFAAVCPWIDPEAKRLLVGALTAVVSAYLVGQGMADLGNGGGSKFEGEALPSSGHKPSPPIDPTRPISLS